jgi:hypothetical protein
MDSDNHNFSVSSGGDNDGEPREKGLPTIFKYQGQGKEVYVCGKLIGIGLLGWIEKGLTYYDFVAASTYISGQQIVIKKIL